jgi:hypothetical protein
MLQPPRCDNKPKQQIDLEEEGAHDFWALTEPDSLEKLLKGTAPAPSWKNILQSSMRWPRLSWKLRQELQARMVRFDTLDKCIDTLLLSLDGYVSGLRTKRFHLTREIFSS